MIKTSYYTLNGRKAPETDQIIELSSFNGLLMENCFDFMTETPHLQFLGSQLGVQVMLTPKLHCESAGDEGIEYAWAAAKAKMRITPIREKKGPTNFISLVLKCLCPSTVLTKERIRKFAARGTPYLYKHLVLLP